MRKAKANGGTYRSGWERRLAEMLTTRGIPFEYEPHTFSTPTGLYTPDFFIPSLGVYIEVKGRPDPKQARKMKWVMANHPCIFVESKPSGHSRKYDPTPTVDWVADWSRNPPSAVKAILHALANQEQRLRPRPPVPAA